jgi:hypothetical protein
MRNDVFANRLPSGLELRAEAEKRDGFLEFDTWERINQADITPDIRRLTLRFHHL